MNLKQFLDKYWVIIIVTGSIFFATVTVLLIPQSYQITCADGQKHIFENKNEALEKYNNCVVETQNYINFNNINFNDGIK